MKTHSKMIFLAGCVIASLAIAQIKDSLNVNKIESAIAVKQVKPFESLIKYDYCSFRNLFTRDCRLIAQDLQVYCAPYAINDFLKITNQKITLVK